MLKRILVVRVTARSLLRTLVAFLCVCAPILFSNSCARAWGQVLPAAPKRLPDAALPNAVAVHPRVISGGLPETDSAFEALVQLGVRTVISVDGATPDVEKAARFGLRYIHLPHGYDGIPRERQLELAKALLEPKTPVYIHCHHGRHRSPAAAAVACLTAGLISRDAASEVLNLAGTSRDYAGLYAAVANAEAVSTATLDDLRVEFKPVSEVPPIAESMVSLDKFYRQLKQLLDTDKPLESSDRNAEATQKALLVQEQFTELLRMPSVVGSETEFRRLLTSSNEASGELLKSLRGLQQPLQGAALQPRKEAWASIQKSFRQIGENCKSCHRSYRD